MLVQTNSSNWPSEQSLLRCQNALVMFALAFAGRFAMGFTMAFPASPAGPAIPRRGEAGRRHAAARPQCCDASRPRPGWAPWQHGGACVSISRSDGQVTYGYLWDRMENGWMMDASNLSYLSINSYCQVIILIISYLFLDLLVTRPRSISSQRQHQVPIASPGSITHGQAHAAHRREPQIHAARGVCSHFSGIYIYISYLIVIIYIYTPYLIVIYMYIYISYLMVIIYILYIYHIW